MNEITIQVNGRSVATRETAMPYVIDFQDSDLATALEGKTIKAIVVGTDTLINIVAS